jgi:hypothetical protein
MHAMHPTQPKFAMPAATAALQATATLSTTAALPTTPALAAVPALPITPALATVPALPITPKLATVPALPITPALAAVPALPATAVAPPSDGPSAVAPGFGGSPTSVPSTPRRKDRGPAMMSARKRLMDRAINHHRSGRANTISAG